jgi:hypothetical protein
LSAGELESQGGGLPGPGGLPGEWIAGLLGALVSVFLLRSGFLGIFFLVPLGFAGCSFGRGAAWRGALAAALLNTILSLIQARGRDFAEFLPDLGYFFVVTAAFTWLMAPPASGPKVLRLRAAYRLILGALAGTAALVMLGDSAGLGSLIAAQAEIFSSLIADSAGGDAARRSLLEQELSPQRLLEIFNRVLLRGGALASSMIVFFVSRRLSLSFAALRDRSRGGKNSAGSLKDFHAPAFLVWVFSCSLAGILLFRLTGLGGPETAAWNTLTLCALVYLAQGFGIARSFLDRRELPGPLRFFLNVGIVLAILSPGINMAVLGALILLGIVEYWVPMRGASGTLPDRAS